MFKKRGNRIVKEHGHISNVLPGLHLVDQLAVAGICDRTYHITVSWNVSAIILHPKRQASVFPKINDIPDNFVCKRIETKIIVEELLDGDLLDYKFFCNSGGPFLIQVDVNRFTNHQRNIYDLSWKRKSFFI